MKAVLFDIGGVLEVTPSTGWEARWEADLGLQSGRLQQLTDQIWTAGSIGLLTEREVHARLADALDIDDERVQRLM